MGGGNEKNRMGNIVENERKDWFLDLLNTATGVYYAGEAVGYPFGSPLHIRETEDGIQIKTESTIPTSPLTWIWPLAFYQLTCYGSKLIHHEKADAEVHELAGLLGEVQWPEAAECRIYIGILKCLLLGDDKEEAVRQGCNGEYGVPDGSSVLAVALKAFLDTDSYRACIDAAEDHPCRDVDSAVITAAVLAGLHYGEGSFPMDWRIYIEDAYEVRQNCQSFYNMYV